MYVKLNDGSQIDVIDLNFFCKCPICGREVAVPEFFEYFENKNFDPYDSRIYCDDCTRESQTFREILMNAGVTEPKLTQSVLKSMELMHSGVTA